MQPKLLKRVPFLAALSGEDLRWLAKRVQRRKYNRGDIIFVKDDPVALLRYHLQLGHAGAVSMPQPQLHNSRVAARPRRIPLGQAIKHLVHYLLVVHKAQRLTTGVQVAPLAHLYTQ